jgi:hypothetical protein
MIVAVIDSFLGFVVGLLLTSMLVPELELKGLGPGARAATLFGLVSAGLGRLAKIVLSILFFPILLLGPIGDFLVQAGVNVALLIIGPLFVEELEVTSHRAAMMIGVGLAALQVVLQVAIRYVLG